MNHYGYQKIGCVSCRFWTESYGLDGLGQCREGTPQTHSDKSTSQFPVTCHESICGRYQPESYCGMCERIRGAAIKIENDKPKYASTFFSLDDLDVDFIYEYIAFCEHNDPDEEDVPEEYIETLKARHKGL